MNNKKRMTCRVISGLVLVLMLGWSTWGMAADGENTPPPAAPPAAGGETAKQPCPECPECPDPAKVVLRGLEEKKAAIEEEARALAQERKELEAYEAQIDEKLASMAALKKQISDDLAQLDQKKSQKAQQEQAQFEAKVNRLVKMYAGMKPRAAAQIVNELDLDVAQAIFMRMREASASEILSFVAADKAAKISGRLAYQKK